MPDLEKIAEELSSLTVIEAADLSKMLEEKRGVSAAAPVAVAVAAAAGAAAAGFAEDMTVLDVLKNPVIAAEIKKQQKQVLFIWLDGGMSQLETWDPKPGTDTGGPFLPIPTSVPGTHICEHLPMLARQMDKLCLLRSMTHHMNVHGPACGEIFSGREYPFPPTTDQARPEDWPSLSALTMRYARPQAGLPSSIVLPWYLQFPGQSKPIAGQTGGRMGRHHGAMLVEPTETESKAALDQFIMALRSVAERAKTGDEALKSAPHYAPRRRLDETQAARKPVLAWNDPDMA